MPTHGLPREHKSAGPGQRVLDSDTVNVADGGTVDTGFSTVNQAFGDAAIAGDYNVSVHASGGTLTFEVYDVAAGGSQGSAIDVDYVAIAER